MVFPVHVSSLSHEGGSYKCGVHSHRRGKIHASETLCIFFLIRLPIIWNWPCKIPFVLSSYTIFESPSCVLL